jgi:hypothetical protein
MWSTHLIDTPLVLLDTKGAHRGGGLYTFLGG